MSLKYLEVIQTALTTERSRNGDRCTLVLGTLIKISSKLTPNTSE